MAERKPASMSFGSFVDQQVRAAEDRGDFADLPGAGKPIPDIDRPADPLLWVAQWARRENVDVAAMLPPSLALRKEIEGLADRLDRERVESEVRAQLAELNRRIADALRQPPVGPIVPAPVDIDLAVAQWRERRAARAARPRIDTADTAAVAVAGTSPAARRRWWWRTHPAG